MDGTVTIILYILTGTSCNHQPVNCHHHAGGHGGLYIAMMSAWDLVLDKYQLRTEQSVALIINFHQILFS